MKLGGRNRSIADIDCDDKRNGFGTWQMLRLTMRVAEKDPVRLLVPAQLFACPASLINSLGISKTLEIRLYTKSRCVGAI
jgi:hypothetical protein